jgi:putative oxidoreductase
MSNTWQENAGLLALRAGVGGVLVAHGVQKLFGWFGGHGLTDTGDAFEQIGFQPGRQSALAAGLGEAGGGVLIALGLATPAAGAAAAGTIALVGLKSPVRAGLTYPVLFTFEHAGQLRIEIPVENPEILPPRARDAADADPPTSESGPR